MYQAIITYGVKLWDGVSYRWYCRDAWGRCLQMFTYSVLVCDILDIAYLHQLCQLLYKFRLQIWEIHHEAWSICMCTDLRSKKRAWEQDKLWAFCQLFRAQLPRSQVWCSRSYSEELRDLPLTSGFHVHVPHHSSMPIWQDWLRSGLWCKSLSSRYNFI